MKILVAIYSASNFFYYFLNYVVLQIARGRKKMLCQKMADFDTIGQNALQVSWGGLLSYCVQQYALFILEMMPI